MLRIIRFRILPALLIIYFLSSPDMTGQSSRVKLVRSDKSWILQVNGHPFYIKGVVGNEYLSKVKEYGGNSIRIGWHRKELDEARNLGLNALVNLPANAERYGMDYNDTAAVRKQTDGDNFNRKKNKRSSCSSYVGNRK